MRAYVGLGSNLGDRVATLGRAVDDLKGLGQVVACSSLWESEAIGCGAGAPDFLNAVAAIEAEWAAQRIVDALLAIEERHGRVRTRGATESRTLDLDLLLLGDTIVDTERVTLPHPRLHERAFVLVPLAEIAPLAIHPRLHRTMAELRAALLAMSAGRYPVRTVNSRWATIG